MIYVIYTSSGSEQAVMYELLDKGYKAYVPRELYSYRKGGRWHDTIRLLFDGYVFVDIAVLTPEIYYDIKSVYCVGGFVSKTTGLSDTESEYIIGLCKNRDIVQPSTGHIVDGHLRIDSGYLQQYENKIVKYSRRQHKAVIEITLYGEPHRITCTVNIK